MQLPIVSPAPLVTQDAATFADLFENQCQVRHFQNYLTGLLVLPNKSLANIARCILDSADKSNLSRFFSEAQYCGYSLHMHPSLTKTQMRSDEAESEAMPCQSTPSSPAQWGPMPRRVT